MVLVCSVALYWNFGRDLSGTCQMPVFWGMHVHNAFAYNTVQDFVLISPKDLSE